MNRVFNEIKADLDLKAFINDTGIDFDLAIKTLAYMAIYKRLTLDMLVAMLFRPKGNKSSDKKRLITVTNAVEQMARHRLFNYDTDKNQAIVRFELDDKVQKEISAFQYPLPLIVPPKLIKHNMSSAYYQKQKQSVLLHKRTTRRDVCLEHLNLMNQVAFSINTKVLKKAKNEWSEHGKYTKNQIDRFNRYCGISQNLMTENGNEFYFSHRYDYRGRCYCEGYYLNYQGNDYCKSVIEFANKEIVA